MAHEDEVISCDCETCELQAPCILRYRRVSFGERVYCPDGTGHLVDESSLA